MSDDWSRQRDIEAEGQRAALYHAEQREGASLPSLRNRRILGINTEGRPVDNVTEKNRYDVDPKNPWIPVLLFSEDKTQFLKAVYMPNTRERPDALVYEGELYEVVTTRTNPAQYRKVMWLQAVEKPT